MRINVSQQLKASIGSTRDYKVDETINITSEGSMVQGEAKLIRTDRGILVKSTLHTELEVTCSRCLGLFDCALNLNIEEEYFSVTDVVSGHSLSLPDEPGCFTIDEHHVIDLTEAIRQYALMAIPMKPLCRSDCAGLCPKCGHNLNEGPCDCSSQQVKPRQHEFSKLMTVNEQKGT